MPSAITLLVKVSGTPVIRGNVRPISFHHVNVFPFSSSSLSTCFSSYFLSFHLQRPSSTADGAATTTITWTTHHPRRYNDDDDKTERHPTHGRTRMTKPRRRQSTWPIPRQPDDDNFVPARRRQQPQPGMTTFMANDKDDDHKSDETRTMGHDGQTMTTTFPCQHGEDDDDASDDNDKKPMMTTT